MERHPLVRVLLPELTSGTVVLTDDFQQMFVTRANRFSAILNDAITHPDLVKIIRNSSLGETGGVVYATFLECVVGYCTAHLQIVYPDLDGEWIRGLIAEMMGRNNDPSAVIDPADQTRLLQESSVIGEVCRQVMTTSEMIDEIRVQVAAQLASDVQR